LRTIPCSSGPVKNSGKMLIRSKRMGLKFNSV
jgi:hypothetical protein